MLVASTRVFLDCAGIAARQRVVLLGSIGLGQV